MVVEASRRWSVVAEPVPCARVRATGEVDPGQQRAGRQCCDLPSPFVRREDWAVTRLAREARHALNDVQVLCEGHSLVRLAAGAQPVTRRHFLALNAKLRLRKR